jgi:hypothetical protein
MILAGTQTWLFAIVACVHSAWTFRKGAITPVRRIKLVVFIPRQFEFDVGTVTCSIPGLSEVAASQENRLKALGWS